MRVFGRGSISIMDQYGKIVVWLRDHRELWKMPEIELARTLRAKGFYSRKTSLCDIKVDKLLKRARRITRRLLGGKAKILER